MKQLDEEPSSATSIDRLAKIWQKINLPKFFYELLIVRFLPIQKILARLFRSAKL